MLGQHLSAVTAASRSVHNRSGRHQPAMAAAAALGALVILSGCSDATDAVRPPAPASANATQEATTPAAQPTPQANPVTEVSISIASGEVTPAPTRVRIDRGDKVRLTVSSDVEDKVHLHGYDIEKPVAPNKPAVIAFTATEAGLFELETHEEPVLILTQLQIQ